MIVYPLAPSVAHRQLTDLIRPEDIGARILQGSPALSAAVDFHENGMMAGIFESTRGKLEVRFPFTEHATIIEGEVIITDEAGLRQIYGPGDSFLIRQGQVVTWDVQGPRVRKCFLNVVVGTADVAPAQHAARV